MTEERYRHKKRVWVRPEYEFNDGRFERLPDAKRETFEVPEGHEAVRDADGRATGEVRKVDPTTTVKVAVTAEDHNAAFDPANDALGGAFKDGFREGWLFAKDPCFDDREELEADYSRAVDIAPSECWDAYRSHYFAMLPLAAIPDVGEAFPAPAPHLLVAAKEVIACASDTYKKRNGHIGSFEDDSGEKCWIVPFDAFEGLRAALASTEGLDNG